MIVTMLMTMNCSQSPPSKSFSPTSLISETNHNDGGTNDNKLALVTQMMNTARDRQFSSSAGQQGSIHGRDVVGQMMMIFYYRQSEGQRRWPRRGRAGRCLGRCLSYFHRSSIIIIIIIFINVVVVVIVIIIIIILCSLSLSSPPLSVAAVY